MSFTVRRVVTGHDAAGKAVVASDGPVMAAAPRPGQEACVIWADPVPTDNAAPGDGAALAAGSRLPGGAVFRLVRYAPGASGNMHRTLTTDYGVVTEGTITLELDDGLAVHLAAGDVLVQRGTIHRWHNPGPGSCTVAFILLDAAR
ncbi:cupin domain-containing protein [Novosphingobium flavum]|uniref:Cupin domain-containing protein n=1 Tax=Novosphingobium flavum TaxID=1778672 RepID=A0A7X1FQY8_9SPHN|nr:cupin domain-containing protein [Novosphingobium flavum]MBC2665298.1 cupin domain-containing protein [Novosphingobium flavum]